MLNFKQCLLLAAATFGLVSCSSSDELEIIDEQPIESVRYAKPTANKQLTINTQTKNTLPENTNNTVDATPAKVTPKAPGISVSQVSIPDKVVALTFDDGPHPSLTPRLLDILDKHGVKATFFVLGQNVRRYPDIVRRAAASGHEIASHSDTHPNLGRSSQEKIFRELDATESAIINACGKKPKVMRPPYGSMTSAQRQSVYNKYGYHIILWNVDPLDWKKPGSSVVASRLANGCRPGGILLAHDIHASTIDAMDSAINQIKAKGYRFTTVSNLLSMGYSAARKAKAEAQAAAQAPVAES